MPLNGTSPLTQFHGGAHVGGTPHNKAGVSAFQTASQLPNMAGHAPKSTHETRVSQNGIPHVNMHPSGV